MKSKMCKGCRCYWPKGSTAFSYDVCNFKFLSTAIQQLDGCPNEKPIYGKFMNQPEEGHD